jgi:hypothetical protein
MNIVYTYLMESLRVFPAPWLPNAGAHLPPEAGAQRTLEAVRCSAVIMIEASPTAYPGGMLAVGKPGYAGGDLKALLHQPTPLFLWS